MVGSGLRVVLTLGSSRLELSSGGQVPRPVCIALAIESGEAPSTLDL